MIWHWLEGKPRTWRHFRRQEGTCRRGRLATCSTMEPPKFPPSTNRAPPPPPSVAEAIAPPPPLRATTCGRTSAVAAPARGRDGAAILQRHPPAAHGSTAAATPVPSEMPATTTKKADAAQPPHGRALYNLLQRRVRRQVSEQQRAMVPWMAPSRWSRNRLQGWL